MFQDSRAEVRSLNASLKRTDHRFVDAEVGLSNLFNLSYCVLFCNHDRGSRKHKSPWFTWNCWEHLGTVI